MEGAELLYRAFLGRIYGRHLLEKVEDVTIVYDDTPSCVAIAASVTAVLENVVNVVKPEELTHEVDNALLVMSPHLQNLGERAASVLRKVRKFVALHTPVFYALDDVKEAVELLRGKEVRFAVRETPREIIFYRVSLSNGEVKLEPYFTKTLSPREMEIVRKFEVLKT